MQQEMRAVSLALAACEKTAQIIYERNLRPAAFQYEPWLARLTRQLLAAYSELELLLTNQPSVAAVESSQSAITLAIAWQFTQSVLPKIVLAGNFPQLARLSARMEQTAAFRKYPPTGPGVQGNQ
jgi:glutathione S-transferase